MSHTSVEVASEDLKVRVLDISGCRSSLSLCSTRQVWIIIALWIPCVLGEGQHWAGDEGIEWLCAWMLLTALDACSAVRVLQEGKVLSRSSIALCLQKDFVVQCLRGKEGGNDGVIRAKLPKSHFHLISVSLCYLYISLSVSFIWQKWESWKEMGRF